MKAANRTDQTNVPDTLKGSTSCLDCLGVCVCVCICVCVQTKLPGCCSVWKAIGIEPLSWNTIVLACVYCICLCVRPFYLLKHNTDTWEDAGGPLALSSSARLSSTPHRPPFGLLNFSALMVGPGVSLEICVRWSFGVCVTHPVCNQNKQGASETLWQFDLLVFCLNFTWKTTGIVPFFPLLFF